MTFDAAVPQDNESPALFPNENRVNMSQVYKVVNADHQFNTTAMSTDGYHKVIRFITQSVDPAITSGVGKLYTKVEDGVANLYYRAGDIPGTITRLSSPGVGSFVQRAVDSSSYNAAETKLVYNPGNDFTSIVWATVPSTGQFICALCTSIGGGVFTLSNTLYTNGAAGGRPSIIVDVTGISIKNNAAAPLVIKHSIMSNITP